MGKVSTRAIVGLASVMACCVCAFALNPAADVSQYAHTAWTIREGFFKGNIYAMTQTPDGYLWLGTEFGLLRFDGVRRIPWEPPAGQHLPDKAVTALLVARDRTLWIGTAVGLATWSGGKLTEHAELGQQFVASLFEDRDGTVWAGTLANPGRLCALRSGRAQCYGEDGAFGRAVWALYEDSSGTLWAGAQSGLWRMNPGPARRYPTRTEIIGLGKTDDGRLLIALHSAGLMQLAGDNLESYPIRSVINSNRLLADRDIDSNRVLSDRDGGLWIGTVGRGLIHVHQGRTDVFSRTDSLSGDVVLSVFEDREGNVWVATTGGLDRFRNLPVTTISVKQGLSSDATQSVLAATDGSVWVGAHEGLTRWKNGQATIFGRADGLPDDAPQSLFQDDRGRIWVFTGHGLAYFKDGRFVAVNALPGGRVHFITGDKAGNIWLSEEKSLLHLLDGRLVEQIPWSELGRHQRAQVLFSGREQGGVWLGFWQGGGLLYFKDGQLRATYTAPNGLGEGAVGDLQLDWDGTLWAATQAGVSRVKDGRIITLTSRSGLPCDTIHWTIEDDDRSFWLYTDCGLVRIMRTELDAWVADPERRIETAVWNAADGVRLRSAAASEYGPRVAKSTDGKLWFVTGEGVQVIDPRHLPFNKLPPPIRIEQITADHKIRWQNILSEAPSNLRLPRLTRDLEIDYTALSLVAPEKVRFKYKLEGYDGDWQDAGNRRQAYYTNLSPANYRFRVMACNNSGVWNEEGATLDFAIDPAFYQANWFRTLCAAAFLGVFWMLYQLHIRQLTHQFNIRMEERVGERTRIARELHDTLLQSFQGLMLRFQTVDEMLPARPTEAKKVLEGSLDRADQAISEGRDAISDMRSSGLVSRDLAKSMTALMTDLSEELAAGNGGPIAFRVLVEGEPRTVRPILQDEICRIARESLRNAFHHAQARQIETEITYGESLLRLRFRDDGTGIDPRVLEHGGRSGHWGLPGMRERAKRVGAQLEVWSELGAGTEVNLSIPGPIAYEAVSTRAGFRFFRKRTEHNHEHRS
jgi:signal transduction histidine kinase/ligand-binding sensor domain-containing protein